MAYRIPASPLCGSFGKGFVMKLDLPLQEAPAAPGRYRLRVVIPVVRDPQDQRWRGRLVSNETPLQIDPKAGDS